MSETPKPQHCGKCGAALSGYAPDGMCAGCLLESAFEEPDVRTGGPFKPGPLLAFADYELLEELARGGMGVVYRARQISLNRVVAIKMILGGHLANAAEMQRFRAEAATAAHLQHPNIVAIHEVGEHAGQPFFAMDLIAGRNLAELVRDGPLPSRKAVGYLKTIAEAVQYAHSRGVLHRDLKPSNILIDDSDQPRITDFGLAKRMVAQASPPASSGGVSAARSDPDSGRGRPENPQAGTPALHELTQTGQLLGSPSFIPPEQAAGQKSLISPASDVYSLGAILYHLLTGRPPFVADTLTATLRMVAENDAVSPRLLNASVPRDLETICLKCLEKETSRRYASAQELVEELGRFLRDEPIQARPAGQAEKAWRWCRRKPTLAAAAGAALLLLLIVAVGSPIAAIRIAAARDGERRERLRADERELTTRQNLYDVDMNLAQLALNIGDRQRAAMLLEREKPLPGQRDLRGWEWRYFWELTRSDELFTLGTHSNVVTAVAISPDGKLLVSGSYDSSVRVWDLPGRRLLASLPFGVSVYCLQFSPDGRFFAVGGGRTLKVFSSDSREETIKVGASGSVRAVTFSPDGKRLAWYCTDGTVGLWNLKEMASGGTFQAGPLNGTLRGALAFSPDGSVLAIGENQGPVRLVDSSTGTQLFRLSGHSTSVAGLGFTPDGLRLVSCGWDKTVKVWDLATRQALFTLTNHSAWVSSLAISRDGKILATASADQTIRLWDLASGTELSKLQGHLGEVWAVAFAPDGRTIASGGKDDTVKFWSAVPKPTNTLADIPPLTRQVAFSPDGTIVALVNNQGNLVVGDARSLRLAGRPAEQVSGVRALAFSPDGKTLATGNELGQLQFWDTASWQQHQCVTNHSAPVYRLHFSAHGDTVATLDVRGNYVVQSLFTNGLIASGQINDTFFGVHQVAFAPENSRCAVVAGRSVRLLDLRNGRQLALWEGHREAVRHLAYSPDGGTVASAGEDATVRLWDVTSQREFGVLRGHRNGVYWVEFSPDGQRLISGGGEGLIKLWDLTTQREVATFEIQDHAAPAFLAADGNTLVAKTLAGLWHLWRAPSWQEIGAMQDPEWPHVPPETQVSGVFTGNLVALSPAQIPVEFVRDRIPPRPANCPDHLLDLSAVFNATLTNGWLSRFSRNDLSSLSAGIQTLGDVSFDIRGIVQLSSANANLAFLYPVRVDGVRVNRRCKALHFLQATGWIVTPGTLVGEYVIHYADGHQENVPLVYGENLANWWSFPNDAVVLSTTAKAAWRAESPASQQSNMEIRLYDFRWQNPRLDVQIESIDFKSAMTESAPFLLAVTAE